MVQQTVDSKLGEHGCRSNGTDLSIPDKQLPATLKKPVLRDLQNNNRTVVPNPAADTSFLKNKDPISDSTKVSGVKRPSSESSMASPPNHSQGSNAANGHLVYVRRKAEAEIGKSNICNTTRIDADYKQAGKTEDTPKPKPQEGKVSCFPAMVPFPMSSPVNSSSQPSVPFSVGKSGVRLAHTEANYHPSYVATQCNSRAYRLLNWEERYHHLQMMLKKFDQSDQEEYRQSTHST